MSNLEKLLSELLTKDQKHPVTLYIDVEETSEVENEDDACRGCDGCECGCGWGEAADAEDTVTIPMSTYTELLASSVKYEILARSYHASTYGIESGVERAVFGVSREVAKTAEASTEGTARGDA